MEILEKPQTTPEQSSGHLIGNEEKFIPKGAIAFFFVLILLALAIWYGIYFLMLERV